MNTAYKSSLDPHYYSSSSLGKFIPNVHMYTSQSIGGEGAGGLHCPSVSSMLGLFDHRRDKDSESNNEME